MSPSPLQGPNMLSIKLLKMINESGKLHMVPALLNEIYVIRFAICAQNASASDVTYAWDFISSAATELLSGRLDSGKAAEEGDARLASSAGRAESAVGESDDEVFNTDFDDEFIFDHQRCHVRRAHQQRNLFFRMVSDPKSYNSRILRFLGGRNRSSSEGSTGSTPPSRIGAENGHLPNGTPP